MADTPMHLMVFAATLWTYNTLMVLAGTAFLGIASGIVGTFLVLRQRALAGDVIGHAALPGVALAFLIYSGMYPDQGKNLPVILAGGAITSGLGMLCVLWLRRVSRLPDDAVLAIVLSTFFAAGMVFLSVAQDSPSGRQAGLQDFIFGQAAGILRSDVILLAMTTLGTIFFSSLFIKEWTLLCFDEGLAGVLGYPIRLLDFLLMLLTVSICVVGMQAVGLLLMVALLIIPPTAARFWSDSIRPNIWISAMIGAGSATLGVIASATIPKLSTGAIIVVMSAMFLLISMLVGRRHGFLWIWLARRKWA